MTASPGTHAPVFTRLDHLGLIAFAGADARAFLHGQLTCDIESLTPARCRHGGYCTAKGRLLATFLVWQREDAFHMQISGSLREAMQKQLSKFILRSKVKASDASADYACIGVSGEGAAEVLKQVLGTVPAAPYEVRHITDASIIKLPVERYEIAVAAAGARALEDALSKHASAATTEVWDGLDVRAGIPVIAPQTQEEFVPQMVNLDLLGGVSFTKGCYPGQEIVARMHYRGGLKQRMYLVHIAADVAPQAGDRLYSVRFGEQACGMIVRAALAPGGGYDALAVLQINQAQDGNAHWRAIDGPALKRLELPYFVTAA
jgi:folate-binding protein YgfZ